MTGECEALQGSRAGSYGGPKPQPPAVNEHRVGKGRMLRRKQWAQGRTVVRGEQALGRSLDTHRPQAGRWGGPKAERILNHMYRHFWLQTIIRD